MFQKCEIYRQGAKLTKFTCQGAKLNYAISNDCKSYFGRGMNLISIGVKLCIRNLKFTARGRNWRRSRLRGRNLFMRFRTIASRILVGGWILYRWVFNYALEIWSLPPGGETDDGHVSGGETYLCDFERLQVVFLVGGWILYRWVLNYALEIWSLPPGGETDEGHVSGGETLIRDF